MRFLVEEKGNFEYVMKTGRNAFLFLIEEVSIQAAVLNGFH